MILEIVKYPVRYVATKIRLTEVFDFYFNFEVESYFY